jgi:hypothetical protein
MSGRDLLNKPPVQPVVPEEQAEGKPDASKNTGPKIRDIGQEEAAHIIRTALTPTQEKTPAYKSAYFSKDTSLVHQVNQRATSMQALRGSEQALDLKKVVLPPPGYDIQTPNPAHLKDTLQKMGSEAVSPPSFIALLSKQGSWAQSEHVTPATLGQKMLQLEAMVRARMAALGRMALLPHTQKHPTLNRTNMAEASHNIEEESGTLIQHTAEKAAPMFHRIMKALGVKKL